MHHSGCSQAQPPKQPKNPLKIWFGKYEAKTLTAADFATFFQNTAPLFFPIAEYKNTTEVPHRYTYNEEASKAAIISIVEEFICGIDPQILYEKINIDGNVSAVCGRVFKTGEPTYSCRECGMDHTCVLCVRCFKQSDHRNHKYKMATSGGGGCCDCGDKEAWKTNPFCDEHKQRPDQNNESIHITRNVRERCQIAFDAVLHYCVRSLEIESDASLRCLENNGDESDNIFCAILYNDETHTFEQVIQTLTRTAGCHHKDAIEYVSSIDSEGRAVVKCSTFNTCIKLKAEIEKQGLRSTITPGILSLKVAVLHNKAVACQHLALQLLTWLQEFLTRHAIFRKIFCDIIVAPSSYNLTHILCNDWKLWKMARTCWHRLLISGMLMEYENKKILAIAFTKNYPSLMQEFIRDDHDHSFSVVSLSVQLFTVPSIAQHLLTNEAAFFKLIQTFYVESIERYVKKKTVQFAKNTANLTVFKRSACILFDLRYILGFKPTEWTEDLRRHFLHGLQILVKLLKEMQGMDSVYRQTGQHMEYEPEWEAAFNLHIKLAHVITLVLDWCSTDKIVLVKAYRLVIANLLESEFIVSQVVNEVKELADHSASCLMYDVSARMVSIHLPLSRFFAGLYLHLAKYNVPFDTLSRGMQRPTPEQLIEPVLCTQTMIAQVHSGLWRRNGYSLLNQLYFYRNVKCRSEMLDRDIVVLQIGASLIESNEFLIHILNKFNLINWAQNDFDTKLRSEEETLRQIINMIDEMLELLIVIVGERYVAGIGAVTDEDRIKHEIIQQLCIKPFSHSELSRALPDTQQEISMESVINKVAIFKKPLQTDKKGVYELKPEYYSEFNMYFYHYSKEDKSKSDEAQCKRRKENKELVCCPPPPLPRLTESFSLLTNLLQCDVMLTVMQIVLKRANDLKSTCFVDSHLQKILYLIGYALHEEESGHYSFFTFYNRASKWGILQLIEDLVTSVRVEAHRDLIIWTVKKFKELDPNGKPQTVNDENIEEIKSIAEGEKLAKEERARLAAERRAKIMAQMANQQQSFMSSNAALFEKSSAAATSSSGSPSTSTLASSTAPYLIPTTSSADKYDDINMAASESPNIRMDWQDTGLINKSKIKCLGPERQQRYVNDELYTCILCSEDSLVTQDGNALVYAAFIQKSYVLQHCNEIIPSAHTSTCGHVMHAKCWREYFENEVLKESRRPLRNRSTNNTNNERKEFVCPLCRCLSNTVLPILPSLSRFNEQSPFCVDIAESISFLSWLDIMQEYHHYLENLLNTEKHNMDMLPKEYLPDLSEAIANRPYNLHKFYNLCPQFPYNQLSSDLKRHIIEFAESVKNFVPFPYSATETEPYLITWMSCSYTIQSIDMYLQIMQKPLKGHLSIRQKSCLSGLVRASALFGDCVDNNISNKFIVHLHGLFNNIFVVHSDESYVLNCDVFNMLVSFIYLTPLLLYTKQSKTSIPAGYLMEYYFLKLSFITNIAKIVILDKTFNRPRPLKSTLATSESSLNSVSNESTTVNKKHDDDDDDICKIDESFSGGNTIINRIKEVEEEEEEVKLSMTSNVGNIDIYDALTIEMESNANVNPTIVHSDHDFDEKNKNIITPGIDNDYIRKITSVPIDDDDDDALHDGDDEYDDYDDDDDDDDDDDVDVDNDNAMNNELFTADMELDTELDHTKNMNEKYVGTDAKLLQYYNKYNLYKTEKTKAITSDELKKIIRRDSKPFLRCSCLLFHFITDIELPDEFLTVKGATFSAMCNYLGLDTDIDSYFRCKKLYKFMKNLAKGEHQYMKQQQQQLEMKIKLEQHGQSAQNIIDNHMMLCRKREKSFKKCVPKLRALIDLPDDYSELINNISTFTCPNNTRDDSRNPTMCLVCGLMLCSMTYCCQKDLNDSAVGACTYHAHYCGADIGIFLRIRDCEILILGMHKGCFMPAPYLDEYGETDQGLRRGNPLRLCKERYGKLQALWLNHGLHEEIARTADGPNVIQFQWNHL